MSQDSAFVSWHSDGRLYVTFRWLYVNVNGTSEVLVDKLVPLLKEFYLLERLWKCAEDAFPFDPQDITLLYVLRGNPHVTGILALINALD